MAPLNINHGSLHGFRILRPSPTTSIIRLQTSVIKNSPTPQIENNNDFDDFSNIPEQYVYIGSGTKVIYQAILSSSGDKNKLNLELKGSFPAQGNAPSWVQANPSTNTLYATLEGTNEIASYRIDTKNGGYLNFLGKVSSGGLGPCYLSLDLTGRKLCTANYGEGTGTYSFYNIKSDGTFGSLDNSIPINYINKKTPNGRQDSSHPHMCGFDKTSGDAYGVDLGTDSFYKFKYNYENSQFTQSDIVDKIKLPQGSGPRHFVFSRDEKFLYIVTELSRQVIVYNDPKTDSPMIIQQVSTEENAPQNNKNEPAEILLSPNGEYLFISNRNNKLSTITTFKINQETGKLIQTYSTSSFGKNPRGLSFDKSGNLLLAANENSNSIEIFKIHYEKNGKLKMVGSLNGVKSPQSFAVVGV